MSAGMEMPGRRLSLDDVLDGIRRSGEATGITAYLVGGFVRDRLLGRTSKDIDLVSVGHPGIPLLEHLSRELGWSRPQVFERFGTAQCRGDGFIVEIVQARGERYDPRSRRPQVRPGTLEEDITRRDFTCNALAQTLEGRVIDLTGKGVDDLCAGVLRTPLPPQDTFSEDPLRMFRAARFVAQLGFRLADGVVEAMRTVAARTGILSPERISEELRRLLISSHPRQGMEVLRAGGLLDVVLPEVAAMAGVEQSGFHIYDVWGHSVHALDHARAELVVRTATLLHDVGKPPTAGVREDGHRTFHGHPEVGARMTREILQRLRFSNEEIEQITLLVRLHLRPIMYDAATWSDSAVRRLIREVGSLRGELLAVARADTMASAYAGVAGIDALEARMAELDRGGGVSDLRPALGGERLMELCGRGPGPWIGAVHRALEEAVLDGDLPAGDAPAAERWLAAHPEVLPRGG